MHPRPQPRQEREPVDELPATDVAIINPSIMLKNEAPSLEILLSRDTLVETDAIHLRGVRLITIPLGLRLVLIRLLSRFYKIRLPDELEFTSLCVNTQTNSLIASRGAAIGHVEDPGCLIQLTATEYNYLSEVNGRTLHKWIVERFAAAQDSTAGLQSDDRRAA